jgi:hypothetical protein
MAMSDRRYRLQKASSVATGTAELTK